MNLLLTTNYELDNNQKDCLKFIEEHKMEYLKFLCSNIDGYPFVCDYSSQILIAFLSEKFNLDCDITCGSLDGDDEMAHYWIEVGPIKVDFTICQFHEANMDLISTKYNNFVTEKSHNEFNAVYDEMILGKVPFPFIDDSNEWYDRLESWDLESCPSQLKDIARNSLGDFNRYLELVSEYTNMIN